MQYQFDFGHIKVYPNNIVELRIENGVTVDIEVTEQIDFFINDHICGNFALLINKINDYDFTFEAKLVVASDEHLVAIAAITYNSKGKDETNLFKKVREMDNINVKAFDAYDLGRDKAIAWLDSELTNAFIKNECY